MAERDPHTVLGVAPEASEAEIHGAYRRLAKRYHPDINTDPGAESRFKEIAAAYEALSRKEKARGDQSAAQEEAATAASEFARWAAERQRRGGRRAAAATTPGPRFGLGAAALVCLLLALLVFVAAHVGGPLAGGIGVPRAARFFIFGEAALLVARAIGRVLSPEE
jgi:DnaJ domain